MAKLNYIYAKSNNAISIVDCSDQGPFMSVTNGAEQVIKELAASGVLDDDTIVVYRDTEERWDQLLHSRGCFIGFMMLGGTSQQDALHLAGVRQKESEVDHG